MYMEESLFQLTGAPTSATLNEKKASNYRNFPISIFRGTTFFSSKEAQSSDCLDGYFVVQTRCNFLSNISF